MLHVMRVLVWTSYIDALSVKCGITQTRQRFRRCLSRMLFLCCKKEAHMQLENEQTDNALITFSVYSMQSNIRINFTYFLH